MTLEAHISSFLLPHLFTLPRPKPLFVGISGPQGSGKTTVATELADALRADPRNLTVAVLSIDDLYLTHPHQTALAAANPDNPLLQHRGVPGTHDLALAHCIFESLEKGDPVELPVYDKSAFSGAGDRAAMGTQVEGKVDVVLFEGWCVGFRELGDGEVEGLWKTSEGVIARHKLQNLVVMNEELKGYRRLTDMLDVLIQIDAEDIKYVYQWRMTQEHALIAARGTGMSDEAVCAFVDGYMPAYELYVPALRRGVFAEKGRQLRVVIGRKWEIVRVEEL